MNRGLDVIKIGPSAAPIARIQDKYRKIIYIKSRQYRHLIRVKDITEQLLEQQPDSKVQITFDFSLNAE